MCGEHFCAITGAVAGLRWLERGSAGADRRPSAPGRSSPSMGLKNAVRMGAVGGLTEHRCAIQCKSFEIRNSCHLFADKFWECNTPTRGTAID